MMTALAKETKNLIDEIPKERLVIAKEFLLWLTHEDLTKREWKKVLKGEEQIARGECVKWRDVARTV